jgi:hypothetical protein
MITRNPAWLESARRHVAPAVVLFIALTITAASVAFASGAPPLNSPGVTDREVAVQIAGDETDEFAGFDLPALSEPENTPLDFETPVARPVWVVYAPVTYGVYDYTPTGVHVRNNGPGDVRLTLPTGPSRAFSPGPGEWWFPMGGGRYVVNAASASGPCKELADLGGNSYNIEIDFRPGELRHLSFVCLDASRPPDGTGWTLYYYLEPAGNP